MGTPFKLKNKKEFDFGQKFDYHKTFDYSQGASMSDQKPNKSYEPDVREEDKLNILKKKK